VNIGQIVAIVVGVIACLLSLVTALQAIKRVAQIEGRHLQEVVALKERVETLNGIIKQFHDVCGDIREIKADLRWLKGNIDDGR
jgi:hypothetical protein